MELPGYQVKMFAPLRFVLKQRYWDLGYLLYHLLLCVYMCIYIYIYFFFFWPHLPPPLTLLNIHHSVFGALTQLCSYHHCLF